MNKEMKQKIENLGWNIEEYDDEIEIRQHSPLGEDFSFTINKSDTMQEIHDIQDYCYSFDEEEHAEMWIEFRGTKGVPSSIKDLLRDAEDIANMLIELADELGKLYSSYDNLPYGEILNIDTFELTKEELRDDDFMGKFLTDILKNKYDCKLDTFNYYYDERNVYINDIVWNLED